MLGRDDAGICLGVEIVAQGRSPSEAVNLHAPFGVQALQHSSAVYPTDHIHTHLAASLSRSETRLIQITGRMQAQTSPEEQEA